MTLTPTTPTRHTLAQATRSIRVKANQPLDRHRTPAKVNTTPTRTRPKANTSKADPHHLARSNHNLMPPNRKELTLLNPRATLRSRKFRMRLSLSLLNPKPLTVLSPKLPSLKSFTPPNPKPLKRKGITPLNRWRPPLSRRQLMPLSHRQLMPLSRKATRLNPKDTPPAVPKA